MSINDVIIQVRFESIGLKNQYKASKNAFVLEYLNTEMLYSLLNIDKKNKDNSNHILEVEGNLY